MDGKYVFNDGEFLYHWYRQTQVLKGYLNYPLRQRTLRIVNSILHPYRFFCNDGRRIRSSLTTVFSLPSSYAVVYLKVPNISLPTVRRFTIGTDCADGQCFRRATVAPGDAK